MQCCRIIKDKTGRCPVRAGKLTSDTEAGLEFHQGTRRIRDYGTMAEFGELMQPLAGNRVRSGGIKKTSLHM